MRRRIDKSPDEYWWVGLLYCGGDKNLWACNHADGDSQAIVRPPESAGVTQVCSSSGVLAFGMLTIQDDFHAD